MLTCNRFGTGIFKWLATFFFNFSALISNMVTLDSYYPQKQKLLGVLKIFKSDRGSWDQNLWEPLAK